MATERKLIYADDARRAILETDPKLAYCIDKVKAVDAVEVVRCKDCKHMKIDRSGYRWCLVWTGINGMGDEGFCNYGERKDND